MIAVDTNILVALRRMEYPQHERAREIFRHLAENTQPWAIPWHCVHEFISVVTNPRIFQNPTRLSEAMATIETLALSPSFRFIGETSNYWPVFTGVLRDSGVTGAQIHDARIAATCLDHGVRELWTADRDFRRFAGLTCRNPLAGTFPPRS